MGTQTVVTDHSFLIPYVTGRTISNYCERKKISLEDMAIRLSLSIETVKSFKDGSRVPDTEVLGDMATMFGINLSALIKECRTV